MAFAALGCAILLSGCIGPVEHGPTGNRVDIGQGSRLFYHTVTDADDPGNARDVVLVPAGSLIGPDLTDLAQGRTLVCYDGRSEGRSDTIEDLDRIDLDADVRDIETLRAHLGAETISLIGWSYWGGVAAQYAERHPERVERLVLISPLPIAKDPHWQQFVERASQRFDLAKLDYIEQQIAAGLPDQNRQEFCLAYTRFFLETYVARPSVIDRMLGDPCARPNNSPVETGLRSEKKRETLGDWDWRDAFTDLDVPVLVLAGDEDVIPPTSSKEWAATLPDARLVVFENCGHLPWLEVPAEFFPTVDAFLLEE